MDNDKNPTLFDTDELVVKTKEKYEQWIATRDSRMMDFSYSFITTGFQKLPIYGKRLVYRLMEHVYHRQALSGQSINEDFKIGAWADEDIEFNVRDFLGSEKDSNYRQVKDYIKGLMTTVTEERNSKGDVRLSHFIQSCDLERSGKIIIRVDRRAWEKLLDFANGFERGDLEVLLQCEGEYTALAYLLFASENRRKTGKAVECLSFNIDTLRKIFCLDQPDEKGRLKYPRAYDFVNNVIAPPATELAKFSPWTYEYKTEMGSDGPGRPGIKKVTFYRKHILENEPKRLELRTGATSMQKILDPYIYDCLTSKLKMSNKEIQNNIEIIKALQERDLTAFAEFMSRNIPDMLRAEHPKAYAIGAMKKYLNNSIKKDSTQRQNEATSIGDLFGNILKQ